LGLRRTGHVGGSGTLVVFLSEDSDDSPEEVPSRVVLVHEMDHLDDGFAHVTSSFFGSWHSWLGQPAHLLRCGWGTARGSPRG